MLNKIDKGYGIWRAVSACVVWGLASPFVLPAHAQTQDEQTMTASSEQTEIIAVLSAVAADWNSNNYAGLARHWDQSDDHPIYLAEESDAVMTSWSEVEAYWSASEQWIEWIHVEYANHKVKRVDETNAMITFDLRFDLKLNDRPKPIGGDNRAVVSLRLVDGAWKIHSWVEAPLSAMTYMRKLYELNVRDDLDHVR